jgi:hypothetical protein
VVSAHALDGIVQQTDDELQVLHAAGKRDAGKLEQPKGSKLTAPKPA